MKQDAQRKRLITKIHIAKQQLAMNDEEYRALLVGQTGKNSCAKLQVDELQDCLAAMEKIGFVARPSQKKPEGSKDCTPMIKKIGALCAANSWDWDYAHRVGEKMFGKKRVQWLTYYELHNVVMALQVASDRRCKNG